MLMSWLHSAVWWFNRELRSLQPVAAMKGYRRDL
jgi:hypothetical protein